MFQTGQQFGNYTLIRKLGRGGFGEVWLAEKRAKFVTTKVAVKLPHDEQIDHETIKQEAALWEQASGHPNILPIIDADEYDGQIVIVSEYAPDGSLEQWLRQNGKMSAERAVETTIQILDGLEFLHDRNIIHRDLKPANILLQGNTPRLADFGISRAMRTSAASQSKNISGTLAYMSPEALDGKRSKQTDIWSVGVNLYQFLTGELPYRQNETSALITAIVMREFEVLPAYVPPELKTVVARALAKQPENRYKNAVEMREDLRNVLHGREISTVVQADIPKTQQPIYFPEIAPTQKSVPDSSQNYQDEIIARSLQTIGKDVKTGASTFWILGIIGLFLLITIGFGGYLLKNQLKTTNLSRTETEPKPAITNTDPVNNKNVNTLTNINPPPPPATTEPVTAGETMPLKIISKPKADYTKEAREKSAQGTVTLRVTFLASGQIGDITPINGLPYGLTEQAILAARQIRFEPALSNGIPVTQTQQIQYAFTLY